MGLRINNNIASLNAQRNVARTDRKLSKSLERLSTGLRINRAADDPAGLVISETQRAQIVGLNQAVENSERGIALIQTAESALTEVNSLLLDIRELVLDSANTATTEPNALAANQAAIDNALATIDRISSNTQFSTLKLLDGSKANDISITDGGNTHDLSFANSTLSTGAETVTIENFSEATYSVSNGATFGLASDPGAGDYGVDGVVAGNHTISVTQASATASVTGTTDRSGGLNVTTGSNDNIKITLADQAQTEITVAQANYADADALVTAINAAIDASALSTATDVRAVNDGGYIKFESIDEGSVASVTLNTGTNDMLASLGVSDGATDSGLNAVVEFDQNANTITDMDGDGTSTYTLEDANGNSVSVELAAGGLNAGTTVMSVIAATGDVKLSGGDAVSFTAGQAATVTSGGGDTVDVTVGESVSAAGSEGITVVDNSLVFQVGANRNQTVKIGLMDVGASSLSQNVSNASGFSRLSDVDVADADKCADALLLVDSAIDEISSLRSEIGAFQANTLESNLSSLRLASENLAAAESVIRDVDFASEIAELTKQQILMQSGIAVLATAAQVPQAVLQLLG